MTGTPGSSQRLNRVGVIYVVTMLLIAAGGISADRTPRMVLFGKLIDVQWDEACGCSIGRLQISPIEVIRVAVAGGGFLNRNGYVVLLGHLATALPPHMVVSDRVIALGSVNSDPKKLIRWLRNHRPLAVIVLLLLAAYGWDAISFVAAALATALGCTAAAIALDMLVLWFRVGLADLAWAATLTAAGCGGWYTARHFDAVLQGKAQAVVMSVATALLFRDMVGVIGSIAGVALPALSKRVALAFLVTVAGAIALDLPDIVLQFAAGSSLAVASVDRWRVANEHARRTAPAV